MPGAMSKRAADLGEEGSEDGSALSFVWEATVDEAIEAAWAQQCCIDEIRPVACRNDTHALQLLDAIELCEQLVHHALCDAGAIGAATALRCDGIELVEKQNACCLLYTSPSPRDRTRSRMPSSA